MRRVPRSASVARVTPVSGVGIIRKSRSAGLPAGAIVLPSFWVTRSFNCARATPSALCVSIATAFAPASAFCNAAPSQVYTWFFNVHAPASPPPTSPCARAAVSNRPDPATPITTKRKYRTHCRNERTTIRERAFNMVRILRSHPRTSARSHACAPLLLVAGQHLFRRMQFCLRRAELHPDQIAFVGRRDKSGNVGLGHGVVEHGQKRTHGNRISDALPEADTSRSLRDVREVREGK